MDKKHFGWDEISEGLILVGVTKVEDEQAKRRSQKKQVVTAHTSEIYCPHAHLILNYQETLNDSEKIKFRKYYLRKVMPSEADVIILQDIKDLVLFLLITPVGAEFINFLHLPIIDRFLRMLIIYCQRYIEIWEDLVQERTATMKKAPNPLARGHRSRYAEEMQMLRCFLGKEYTDLILGFQSGPQYHHMMTGKKQSSSSTIMQLQGEKDLRIFEALISIAHRVVWIALQRKHYNLIELELHRLLRTEVYNIAQRQSGSQIIQNMLEDDIRILHGPKISLKRKLLRNSPLSHELIYSICDRLLPLDDIPVQDPKIIYLKNALLIKEEMLPQLRIKVGILGHNRSNYDIMLMPHELEQKPIDSIDVGSFDKKMVEMRKGIPVNQISEQIEERKILSSRKFEYKLIEEFPVKEIEMSTEKYDKIRKEAQRKWILREMKRRNRKPFDTYSLATTDRLST